MTESNEQDQRIRELENEIELVRRERELLRERYELIVEQKRIEDKNYATALSVSTLKVDWMAKVKELTSLMDQTDVELRDAICIDFANKFRVGFLADITNDDLEILILKATAYEVAYRACVATLENRNLRVKLAARDRFTEAVKAQRDKTAQAEKAKIERQVAQSPREKMIQSMISLGMTRETATAQVEILMGAVKGSK